MRILVISDTHLEQSVIPDVIYPEIAICDAIILAGDIGSQDFVDTLSPIGNFHAVHGNTDPLDLTTSLPAAKIATFGTLRIGISHGFSHYENLPERIIARYFSKQKIDILVYGHSHIPLVTTYNDITCINPGSLFMNRHEKSISYGILLIENHSFKYESHSIKL